MSCERIKRISNEIDRKKLRKDKTLLSHESENTYVSDICANVIHESRNNRSRKHHPPIYFSSDELLSTFRITHCREGDSHNFLGNFILRSYLLFPSCEARVDYSRARGNRKKRKRKKIHTIMMIIMKSSLLTVTYPPGAFPSIERNGYARLLEPMVA